MMVEDAILSSKDLDLFYGAKQALNKVSMQVPTKEVTAIIGPSGCGKSTFLRTLNRMNDQVPGVSIRGSVKFKGLEIYKKGLDPAHLRASVGMVFQKPNPFPKTIAANILWAPKIHNMKVDREQLLEQSLRGAGLWDEVKDRLNESGLSLSGGQQQRLCIARAIAMKPEVILMDEPCSALDPKATAKVEELIRTLKNDYTIVIVTHNMQQAGRVSDKTAFFYEGELVEFGETKRIFTNPTDKKTEDYITGRFG